MAIVVAVAVVGAVAVVVVMVALMAVVVVVCFCLGVVVGALALWQLGVVRIGHVWLRPLSLTCTLCM